MHEPESDETFDSPPLPSLDGRGRETFRGLVLVPTPIGNLGDMTARAVAALKAADVVLCEDTRSTARLLAAYGIEARTTPLHEHNEDARTPGVLAQLAEGKCVALVSDAGMPLLSDPGFRLVRAAIEAGHHVGGLPGANAATLALILSGLPPHPYLFAGFPPPRSAARKTTFEGFRAAERVGLSATLIFHEAPHRLAEALADMAAVFGGARPAAVARELTKRFEEIRRGDLSTLANHYASEAARGEIVVLIGPAPAEVLAPDALDAALRAGLDAGLGVRGAADAAAAITGVGRRDAYARALALKVDE